MGSFSSPSPSGPFTFPPFFIRTVCSSKTSMHSVDPFSVSKRLNGRKLVKVERENYNEVTSSARTRICTGMERTYRQTTYIRGIIKAAESDQINRV